MSQDWSYNRIWTLANSYMESRILLTGFEIGLFDLLAINSLTVEEVALRYRTSARKIAIFLDALTAMGVLIYESGTYRCDPSLAPVITRDGTCSAAWMLQQVSAKYCEWEKLSRYVTVDLTTDVTDQTDTDSGAHKEKNNVTQIEWDGVVELINPQEVRRLLMIGISSGRYLKAFLNFVPGMSIAVSDEKKKLDFLHQSLINNNLSEQPVGFRHDFPASPFNIHRVTFQPLDFLKNALPQEFNLAFLSSIVQKYYFAQNITFLGNVYKSLLPGGRIIIREALCAPERNSSYASAIYAVSSIVETHGKTPYTFEEIKSALEQSGFVSVKLLNPDSWMDCVIEAYKPMGY